VIGYFGRVAPEKGLHVLLDAFHRLVQNPNTSSHLRIAGYLAPEHRAYLESVLRQAEAWGLAERVEYVGEVDRHRKFGFLQSLSVLAVPATYDDPKGLALLEAMACGIPVVAPRRGTYTELLERTGGGLLVAPDEVEAVVSALCQLRDDRSIGRALGLRGRAVVRERYTSAAMAERALDVYSRLVPARGTAQA
jgi:glycosyltransferase involved in cell wall biosynthesis